MGSEVGQDKNNWLENVRSTKDVIQPNYLARTTKTYGDRQYTNFGKIKIAGCVEQGKIY